MKIRSMVSYLFCIIILFTVISCTQKNITSNPAEKEEKVVYFEKTSDISITKNIIKVEIEKLYIDKEPQFYVSQPFKNNQELSLVKQINYDLSNGALPSPVSTYFGWEVFNGKSTNAGQESESIIVDKSKYFKNLGYASVFDKSNHLSYVCSTEFVYCVKLLGDQELLSWKFSFKNGQICDWSLGNNIIIYNGEDVLLVDTKTASIVRYYHITNYQQIQLVLPVNGKLWLCCKSFELKDGVKKLFDNSIGVYLVDPVISKDYAKKFNKNILLIKSREDGVVLNIADDFFIVDHNLDTKTYNLSKFHPGAKNISETKAFKGVEVDCFRFEISGKKYFLDIDNPNNLKEEPNNIYILNQDKGHNWDYCYQDKGYCLGYDIEKQETTWKIDVQLSQMVPYYSTENGILFYGEGASSKEYVIKAFGVTK